MFVEARQSTEERAMKTYRTCIAAVAMLAGAISAQAHELDSGEKIVMNCRAGWTPYMQDVEYAVNHSSYSATLGARWKMLTLARQACASGSKRIAFVPPSGRR
jgi:hypothetical protein